MSNPIFSSFNNSNSNSLLGMINQVKNSPNPKAAMGQLLMNNSNFQGVMNYINQNGGDAKTAFYNLAAQKGIDPNSILKQLK